MHVVSQRYLNVHLIVHLAGSRWPVVVPQARTMTEAKDWAVTKVVQELRQLRAQGLELVPQRGKVYVMPDYSQSPWRLRVVPDVPAKLIKYKYPVPRKQERSEYFRAARLRRYLRHLPVPQLQTIQTFLRVASR